MLNKKTKKILTTSLLSATAIISVAATIPFVISNQENQVDSSKNNVSSNANVKYLFNNKYYDSVDAISNELLANNKLISNNLYYGDINNAIFDQEFKRLDINKLRKYDPNRILPAYITSTGGYESDFEKAKRSFVNQGLVRYFYLDNEGKLHYDFDSAKQSNINNIKVDEIVYYKINDVNGNEVKINPLNKDDINLFKQIAIEHLKKENNKINYFDLKIFTKDTANSRTNEEAFALNEELTGFIAKSDNQDGIFKKIENVINKTIQESITLRYDFKMSLTGNQASNYKFQWKNNEQGEKYEVWNKKNKTDSNSPQVEIANKGKELIFRNFSIKEIEGLLNCFSSRKKFGEEPEKTYDNGFFKNEIKIQKWALNLVAEECDWYINLDNSKGNKNKYAIHFNYIGGDQGGAPGIDIQILKDGVQNGGVGFKMELIEKPGKLNNNIEEDYTNMIFNEVVDKSLSLKKADLGVSESIKKLLVDGVANSKEKENDENSILWNMIKKQITKDYLIERNLDGNPKYGFKEFDIKNTVIDPIKDENYSISIDANQKNNAYNKMLNYIKENSQMVVYYQGFPIFEFDKNLLNGNNINENNDLKMSEFLWTNLLNLNNYSQITNISNLNNLTQNSYTKNNDLIVSLNEKNMINIPSNKLNMNGTLNKNNEDGEKTYYDLWYAFNAYNKNLENYLRRNNNSIENIKDELIDLNNVLFLRNGTGDINDEHSSMPLYYANHLGLKNDFNEQISSLVESKFAYDEIILKNLKEASGSINPSKVVILYNISGEIMNPGVKLDDDLALETSSDAIFDLEQNLLDNVMRTLLVQKAEDKFFYLNDDGTKTLVKNKVNQIYTLNWRGNDYHFATFNDARRYLNSIVELLSTRVEV